MAATQEPVARSSSVSGAQENSVSSTWGETTSINRYEDMWAGQHRVGGDGVVVVLGAALPAQTVVRATRAGRLVPLNQ